MENMPELELKKTDYKTILLVFLAISLLAMTAFGFYIEYKFNNCAQDCNEKLDLLVEQCNLNAFVETINQSEIVWSTIR